MWRVVELVYLRNWMSINVHLLICLCSKVKNWWFRWKMLLLESWVILKSTQFPGWNQSQRAKGLIEKGKETISKMQRELRNLHLLEKCCHRGSIISKFSWHFVTFVLGTWIELGLFLPFLVLIAPAPEIAHGSPLKKSSMKLSEYLRTLGRKGNRWQLYWPRSGMVALPTQDILTTHRARKET